MSVELNDITSGYSTGLINDNFQLVEDELNNNVLRRNGLSSGEANHMEVGLDMNSNFVYNLPEPVLEHQAARLQDVQNALADNSANLITFTPYGFVSAKNIQGAIQEVVDRNGTTINVTTSTGTQTVEAAIEARATQTEVDGKVDIIDQALTYNIPTDYATLQDAFDNLSSKRITKAGSVTVNIETGYTVTSGLRLEGGDYSKVTITSVDRPCPVSDPLSSALFDFENCKAPVLDTLFDMTAVTSLVTGYNIERSSGVITSTNGIIFAPGSGLFATGSQVEANGCNFNNSSNHVSAVGSGIAGWYGSVVNADNAQCSNGYVGVNAGYGGVVNFKGGTSINCAHYNVRARENGQAICPESTVTGAGDYNIYAWQTSFIDCRAANAQNGGQEGVRAAEGSIISAEGVTTDGSAVGLHAIHASTIDGVFSSNDNCTNTAVIAEHASTINVRDATGTNATTRSILAVGASTIEAAGFNGNGGVEIRADAGSRINGRGASTPLFRINSGSIMSISTFSSTSETVNTLTANGIIFQT